MKRKRIPAYLVGLFCTCLGVALVLQADWGLDAWNGVFSGLERITPLSLGTWSAVIQGAFLLIAAVVSRKPEWLCIFPILYKGMCLDVSKTLISSIALPAGPGIHALLFGGGYLLVAFGTGLYVATGYPKMPIDGLMTALSDAFFGSITRARLFIEVVGFAALLLVRGPFGIGTVIVTFTIGHAISIAKQITGPWFMREEKRNDHQDIYRSRL